MARISDQVPLEALRPQVQAGASTVGRYLYQNRVMLILTASWSVIILVAVLAMLSLLNPAAVNPPPSPTPEVPVERTPAAPSTELEPTAFENPRALWSLFTAMAAAGCMAGAVIILLGLRRALLHHAVFHPQRATAPPQVKSAAKPVAKPGAKAAPRPVAPLIGVVGSQPSKVNRQPSAAQAVAPQPVSATVTHRAAGASARAAQPLPFSLPFFGGRATRRKAAPVPGAFGGGQQPKKARAAAKSPKSKGIVHPLGGQPGRPLSSAAGMPQPVGSAPMAIAAPAGGAPVPKVASLQKAAQKKAAQASAQAKGAPIAKPAKKGRQQATQSAQKGAPTPILSSLQAGVTIVPPEQAHPLDWHEHGIAEAMDMRKRRPLSSLMMRQR